MKFHKNNLMLAGCVLLHLTSLSLALPGGAPIRACDTMRPNHPNVNAQNVAAPYEITVSQTSVSADRPIEVTLKITDPNRLIGGFIMKATTDGGRTGLGTFDTMGDGNIQKLACSGGSFTVTHTNANSKNQIQVRWTAPPNHSGKVEFIATVAKDFSTFWENIRSQPVFISAQTGTSYGTMPNQRMTTPRQSMRNAALTALYDGCTTSKGCFGFPDKCVDSQSCDFMATYRPQGSSRVDIELMRQGEGYVAVGFSKDNRMGDDSVIHCISGQTGQPGMFVSTNEGKSNNFNPTNQLAIDGSSQFVDGVLICKGFRLATDTAGSASYNLTRDKVFLLLAKGSETINPIGHHTDRVPSTSAQPLSDFGSRSGAGRSALVVAHGSLMIIAWVGLVSIAVFFARYYKPQWPNSTLLGQKVWFTWHRYLNGTAVLCTAAAFILIFVKVQEFTSEWRTNPHPTLGVVVMFLTLCQLLMALLRPHPGTPKRPLFNWAHFILGNLLLLSSHITLYFARTLAGLPVYFWWILISFDVFYVAMFIVMEMFTYMDSNKQKVGTQMQMKEMMNGNHFMTHSEPENRSSTFRNVMLVLFVFGVVAFSVALVVTVIQHVN